FVGESAALGAGEPMDWGDSLGLSHAPSAPTGVLADFEAGNLSALEEERAASRPVLDSHPAVVDPAPIQIPREGQLPSELRFEEDKRSPSKTGLVVFLLVLFAVGGLGGAYFTGALPSDLVQKLGLPAR